MATMFPAGPASRVGRRLARNLARTGGIVAALASKTSGRAKPPSRNPSHAHSPSPAELAAAFYQTRRGRVAARLLRRTLAEWWPDLQGQTVLGLGYSLPYLPLWRSQARTCVNAVITTSGDEISRLRALDPMFPRRGTRGPGIGPASASLPVCAVTADLLPFPELSLDRILLIHAVESADPLPALLRAAWRVLKDDGKLMIVAPNRTGLWSHADATPFGQGRPFSAGQIEAALARSLFRVERRGGALFLPPLDRRSVLRLGDLLEGGGRRLAPNLAGVIVAEAVKDVYAAMPHSLAPARRLLQPAV